ncbi:MAG: IS110 family transposase [Candidatus Aureabacteria bacterium]|nr:IS110 family transposase [Candidatus Auribacterota bacterium]
MALYGGMDLHGDNVYVALIDEKFNRVFERRLPNSLPIILAELEPYRKRLAGLVIESVYNWYWLVDGLQAQRYPTKLANPARMQENIGLKNASDRTDTLFLAKQDAMGVLPQAYIYPKEERPVRDLMRRRMRLVRNRTGEWLSLETLVARHSGKGLGIQDLSKLREDELSELLGGERLVMDAAQICYRHIAFLDREIGQVEKSIEGRVKLRPEYERLMRVPGIGRILTMAIMLETGPIRRFAGPGNYASYCRAVKAEHTSNGRKKGDGNRKSGNRYLAWAYVEAATYAVRYSPELRKWYQRKEARTNRAVAIKALANKLAKACYFILRDGVEFDVKKLVG